MKSLESRQPSDHEKNIEKFATEGCNVIITVGAPMGDGTTSKVKEFPDIKSAILN